MTDDRISFKPNVKVAAASDHGDRFLQKSSNKSSSVTVMDAKHLLFLMPAAERRAKRTTVWWRERETERAKAKKGWHGPKKPTDIERRHRQGDYLSHARQVGTHIWRRVLSAIIYDFLQDLKALRRAL